MDIHFCTTQYFTRTKMSLIYNRELLLFAFAHSVFVSPVTRAIAAAI
jgi:hypothetical protein